MESITKSHDTKIAMMVKLMIIMTMIMMMMMMMMTTLPLPIVITSFADTNSCHSGDSKPGQRGNSNPKGS